MTETTREWRLRGDPTPRQIVARIMIAERRVPPTAAMPFWHVAGHALGAATALMGHRAAMACAVAAEDAIDEHDQAQERALGDDEAEQAPAYRLVSAARKAGGKVAIKLSERI